VSAAAEAADLEAAIRAAGTPERAVSERAYLKIGLEFTGTAVPAARAVVRAWRRDHPGLTRDLLTGVAAALWARPVFDCRMAALLLLADQRAAAPGRPARAADRGGRPAGGAAAADSGTWALVDSLAADVMGSMVERYPELIREAVKPLPPAQREALLAACRACPGGRGAADTT